MKPLVLSLTAISSLCLAQQAGQVTSTGSLAPAPPAASGQAPNPNQTKEGMAIVEGRALNSKTGEPIRRATVSLRSMSPVAGGGGGMVFMAAGPFMQGAAAPHSATTDAEGKFRIEGVEPGNYRLSAERQGFVGSEYGARRQTRMGTSLTFGAGQHMKDLEIKLTPQAILTGRVLDEEGEPLARVQVQILIRRAMRGKAQWMPANGGMTDDTGQYRISGLSPGKYYLQATLMDRSMMMGEPAARAVEGKPEEQYVPTYFPGALDQQSASPIELQAGQEMPGVDVRLMKSQVYRVRGKLVDPSGAAPRNISLMIMPREEMGFFRFRGGPGAMIKPDGTFELAGVLPGSYNLAAMRMEARGTVAAKAPVEVGRQNVEGVVLTVSQPAELAGTARLDVPAAALEQMKAQGQKVNLEGVHINLNVVDAMPFNSPGGSIKADGSFHLEGVGPGKYRVFAGAGNGLYLKSVRFGDQEAIETGFEVAPGATGGTLQLTFGMATAQVDGVVQGADQKPAAGATVMLFSDPVDLERYDKLRTASADQNGRFSLKNVPPGEYRAYAWDELPMGGPEAETLKKQESKSVRISVKDQGQHQVTLEQLPAEETPQ